MTVYTFPTRVDMVDDASAADFNTQARAIEGLGAAQPTIAPQFIAGRYYGAAQLLAAALTTGSWAANVLRAVPFWTGPSGVSVDRIALEVTTGAAGNGRLGIYANHATELRPDALIEDCGTVDTTSSGLKEVTISRTLLGIAPYRIVWLACVLDAAPTLRNLTGPGGPWGVTSASLAFATFGVSMSHTYGALPSSFSGSPTYLANAPNMLVRKA